MTVEADPANAANDDSTSAVERAIRKLVAYASQSTELAADTVPAAPATGRSDDTVNNSTPTNDPESSDNPPHPGEGWGEGSLQSPQRPLGQPSVSEDPGDGRIADDSPSPASSSGGRERPGVPARFESLEGLYQRIAASAAGGGSDEQATQANVETARNTSLILQALEAQNRLLENARGQQSQQILWQ
jgi:hypothetical protein